MFDVRWLNWRTYCSTVIDLRSIFFFDKRQEDTLSHNIDFLNYDSCEYENDVIA